MPEESNEYEPTDLAFSVNIQEGSSAEGSILTGLRSSREGSFRFGTPKNNKISFRKLRKFAKSESNLEEDSDEVVDTAVLNTLF